MILPTPKYKLGDLVIGMKNYKKLELRKHQWIIREMYYNFFLKQYVYQLEELNAKETSRYNYVTVQESLLIVEMNGNDILMGLL